jgi:hypothetical protein
MFIEQHGAMMMDDRFTRERFEALAVEHGPDYAMECYRAALRAGRPCDACDAASAAAAIRAAQERRAVSHGRRPTSPE